MSKIDEARDILKAMRFPAEEPCDVAALTLLALAGVEEGMQWRDATQQRPTLTKGIMRFIELNYGRAYKPNTRESFRKLALRPMMQLGIAERNPGRPDIPTNSMHNFYSLTSSALATIRRYGIGGWSHALDKHLSSLPLATRIRKTRDHRTSIRVVLPNGDELVLRPNKHNELIAAIVEEFVPCFIPDASILYVGDASNRDLHADRPRLEELGLHLSTQTQLPDVVLLGTDPRVLVLVEAVVSGGPIHDTRLAELQELSRECSVGKLFVTAFLDFTRFRSFTDRIAWETEVWIAELPDHLIHYDGKQLLKPR